MFSLIKKTQTIVSKFSKLTHPIQIGNPIPVTKQKREISNVSFNKKNTNKVSKI
jgi:hypothetical protein